MESVLSPQKTFELSNCTTLLTSVDNAPSKEGDLTVSQSHYHLHNNLPHAVMLMTAGVPLDSCGGVFFFAFAFFFFFFQEKRHLPLRFCKGRTKVYLGEKVVKCD